MTEVFWGIGETEILFHCGQKYKLVQPLGNKYLELSLTPESGNFNAK